jgi:hypothetical protein
VGLALAGFVAGAYAYTLHAMGRQESAVDRVMREVETIQAQEKKGE